MRVTAGDVEALPVRGQGVATVVGGDAPGRRDIMRLLRNAGFGLRAEGDADSLIIVLGHPCEAARLRKIRTLTESRPSAWILAVVPAGVPNAALRRVLVAGAKGIVLEEDVQRALVPTARAVLAGQLTVPSILRQQIAPRPLSHREKQILALVMLGMTNREIAGKLFLAESTVKTHLSSAFRKIDARSRAEAVARIQDPEAGYGVGILALADGAAA
jgi:DNA-binding NarL/FixJ family response regulator